MHFKVIQRILGLLLMLFSLVILSPALVSLLYQDSALHSFLIAFFITLITGVIIWLPARRQKQELRTRDGFLVTILFYLILGLFGALPFYIAEAVPSFSDALFESISGLTTTGATVITGLEYLPKSILFYRQLLQWLGGMGIIVLAVAILPMLGIGGMQLYRAETPGPMKDNKLTPRITETAKALWYIYLALTISCAIAYYFAGMDMFDAICHSFSTVAIGGFSTHDASIGYFDSPWVSTVAIVFMAISGINFALHFFAWRQVSLRHYFTDPECRFYLAVLGGIILLTVVILTLSRTYDVTSAIHHGVFQVVSIATTTGFATADFSLWPSLLPMLIFLAAFIGGCAGSTGGGMKVMRVMLICKQGLREIQRLIHPAAIIQVKLGHKQVGDRAIEAVWGFFAVYILTFMMLLMALLATNLDFVTAFSAVAACLNNLGPGLGEVTGNYGSIPAVSKWILCMAMLLGRLDIFTVLVLLSPMFWRR